MLSSIHPMGKIQISQHADRLGCHLGYSHNETSGNFCLGHIKICTEVDRRSHCVLLGKTRDKYFESSLRRNGNCLSCVPGNRQNQNMTQTWLLGYDANWRWIAGLLRWWISSLLRWWVSSLLWWWISSLLWWWIPLCIITRVRHFSPLTRCNVAVRSC